MQAIAPGAPVNLVLEWRLEQAAPHFFLASSSICFYPRADLDLDL
jgi:hypothetical protein